MGDLEYCEKCRNKLVKGKTYYISTNEPPSKTICSKCHDDYCKLMTELLSEYGVNRKDRMTLVRDRITKWFYSDGSDTDGRLKNAKLTFCNDMTSLLEGLDTETAEAFIQWLKNLRIDDDASHFEFWSAEAEAIECME